MNDFSYTGTVHVKLKGLSNFRASEWYNILCLQAISIRL